MIRVLVNGALGRMGQEAVQAIKNSHTLSLVGECGRGDDLYAAVKHSSAQVVLDFTTPDAVFKNTQAILEAKARPVIGTTGLMSAQIAELQAQAKRLGLGGMIVPNFSLAAVLMMKAAAQWIKYFPKVEIIEKHHEGKIDAPSGTALRTAELMAAAREVQMSNREERILVEGARGANVQGIPIHSLRLPGLVAHQEIIFGGSDETLTITHDSIHRRSFMPGVLLACEKVMDLNELVYGLESILE